MELSSGEEKKEKESEERFDEGKREKALELFNGEEGDGCGCYLRSL